MKHFVSTVDLSLCILPVDLSCRSRLANLNDRLSYLEKKVDYIEASVSSQSKLIISFIISYFSTACIDDSMSISILYRIHYTQRA